MRFNTLFLLMIATVMWISLGCDTGGTERPGMTDADTDTDADADADADSDADSDSDADPGVGYVGEHGAIQVNGNQIVDANGAPIQLRGYSWYWSMWQGDWFRADVVNAVVDMFNATVVRAPLGIENNARNDGYIHMDATERAEHLALVETVISAAINKGVYVIIDWHDHWADEHVAEATEFFHYMGQKYGGYPNVIWEIWNEPDYGVEWSVIQNYANTIIPVIRQYSSNVILVGSPNYSYAINEAVVGGGVADANTAYSFHFYVENDSHNLPVAQAFVQAVQDAGWAVFVSEWGLEVSNSDSYVGGGSYMTTPVDDAKVGPWIDWMDSIGLSWVFWSVSSATESSAMFNSTAKDTVGAWDYNADFRTAGQYMYDYAN